MSTTIEATTTTTIAKSSIAEAAAVRTVELISTMLERETVSSLGWGTATFQLSWKYRALQKSKLASPSSAPSPPPTSTTSPSAEWAWSAGGSDGRGQPGGGGQVLVGETQVLDHHRHLPPHHRRHHHRHRLHRLRRTQHHLTLGLSCQRWSRIGKKSAHKSAGQQKHAWHVVPSLYEMF